MNPRLFLDVDPRTLRLPPGRTAGADPVKLARQMARHGDKLGGMPPLWVVRGKDGELQVLDGVTRATRAAKLRPGVPIVVEVTEDKPNLDLTRFPAIGDVLP